MKPMVQSLAIVFLTVTGGLLFGRAELVTRQADSIFDVDGLMVDNSGSEVTTNEIFRTGIKEAPVIDVRKPFSLSEPARSRSSIRPTGFSQTAVQAHLKAADVYAKRLDWVRALEEIQQGLELDRENVLLLRKAAAFAALARKFGLADEYFQKVLNADPNNQFYLAGRAGVLLRLNRLKEAEELVQKALAIDPTFLAARFNKLCVQMARGDTNISEDGWELLSTSQIVELANWLDADKQDYVKALGAEGYKKLCDIVFGLDTEARLKEMIGLLKQAAWAFQVGQWADCETALSKVKNMGVRAVGIDGDIAKCLYEKGDKAAALSRFQTIADQYPNAAAILYDYAYVLINMEQYSQAVPVLERVCKLNPQDGQAAFALACSLVALGQKDKAWSILIRLASSHPSQMPTWLSGDKPYQEAIRNDLRYDELLKSIEAGRQKKVL